MLKEKQNLMKAAESFWDMCFNHAHMSYLHSRTEIEIIQPLRFTVFRFLLLLG